MFSTKANTLAGWKRRLLPSFSDCLFIALIVWLFMISASGWGVLLRDGDTGWHLRTGEMILDTGDVPRIDPFSFSKPEAPWFAWEWLSEVIFALMLRLLGLKGVTLLAGVLIALFGLLLIRYMLMARGKHFLSACCWVAGIRCFLGPLRGASPPVHPSVAGIGFVVARD